MSGTLILHISCTHLFCVDALSVLALMVMGDGKPYVGILHTPLF
jgi:hypothetical protein